MVNNCAFGYWHSLCRFVVTLQRPMGAKSATISYVTNSLDPASQSLDGDSNQGFVANPSPSATYAATIPVLCILASSCTHSADHMCILHFRDARCMHGVVGPHVLVS